jgi:NodT family efflux transporter outer membrane factor (OMF) lipoprotein
MKMSRSGVAITLGLLLSACVLPPKELPHAQPLADDQLGLNGVAVAPAAEGWWKGFDDAQLDRLIDQAFANSPTLAEASARLREAVSQTDAAHAGLLPRAKLAAGATRARAPADYIIPPPYAGSVFWMAQAGASLSWDLDFWGKQADAVAQARALAQSANLEIDNTRLMLAGAIAQSYVELYRAYALSDIASRAEAQRQHIIDITRQRLAAGLDTQLELRTAEGQLPQARVEREQAQAAADLAVHQLAAITGAGAESYASIQRPKVNLDAALVLPADLPINLLARRPDVLAARLQIQAADAQRLASKAAFYPDVSLTALAGFGAFGLNNLFELNARGYGGGPMISLPLFDAGRLRAEYRGSEAALDAAVARYNDTVLKAVQQTADQLTRIDALSRERIDQQQTLGASEDAYRIAEERYRAGLASYLSVLNAETQVLAARRNSIDIVANLAVARVTLLLALGGSFDPAAAVDSASNPNSSSNLALSQVAP